jgi:hypothetical protein
VLLLAGLACVALPKPVSAGTITITTEVSVAVKDRALAITLKITNSGNEEAKTIAPEVRLGDRSASAPSAASLPPGPPFVTTVEMPWDTTASGQWPVVTAVDYTDTNGYPFQAMQVALVAVGTASPSLVAVVDVTASSVATEGTVHARLKSLSEVPRQATVRFLVPRGLEVVDATRALPMAAWSDAQVEAKIVNRSAMAGSRIPVFVTVEYDDAAGHHTSFAHDLAQVKTAESARGWYAFMIAALVMAAWVVVLALQRWRAPRAPVRPRSEASRPPDTPPPAS